MLELQHCLNGGDMLLVAIDYNRKVIRLSECNNVYYSRRSLIQRSKFEPENIYQANPTSNESLKIMFTLLAQHRSRRNDKDYGKEYKLDSYRVRSYCRVLNCKIPYWDLDRDEYDLLTCTLCGELFQATYEGVDNIYRLNEIIMKETYCSDECERFRQNKCLVCSKLISSTYTTCSAKCELQYRHQKNNKKDTRTNKKVVHVWNNDDDTTYYCKKCGARISKSGERYFCSLDCRLEYKEI